MDKGKIVYILIFGICIFALKTPTTYGIALFGLQLQNPSFDLSTNAPLLPASDIQITNDTNFILKDYKEFDNFIEINEIPTDLNLILNERLIQLFENINIDKNIGDVCLKNKVLNIELKNPLEDISLRNKIYENLNITKIIIEYNKEEQSLIIKGIGNKDKSFEDIIYENPKKIIVDQSKTDSENSKVSEVSEMVIIKEKDNDVEEEPETVSAQSTEETTSTQSEEETTDNESPGEITLYTENGESSTFEFKSSLENKIIDIDSLNSNIGTSATLDTISNEFATTSSTDLDISNISYDKNPLKSSKFLAVNDNFPSEGDIKNSIIIITEAENIEIENIELKGKKIISESEYKLSGTLETISGQKSDYEMTVSLDGKQINEIKISFMNTVDIKDKSEKQAIVKISEIDLIKEEGSDKLITLIYNSDGEEKEENQDSDNLFEINTSSMKLSEKTSLESSLSKIFDQSNINLTKTTLNKMTEKIEQEIPDISDSKVVFDINHSENGDFVLNINIGEGESIKIKITRSGRVKTAKIL